MKIARRGLMKLIAAAAPVAVAGHFGISEAMAKDMQRELAKDADRTLIAMPGQTMLDRQSIWFSVADVTEVWARQIHSQHTDTAYPAVERACRQMALAIDHDLIGNAPGDAKVIVEVPKLRYTSNPLYKNPQNRRFELLAGVEQKSTLWAQRTRVGYIQEELIVGEAVNEARRGLFGLS